MHDPSSVVIITSGSDTMAFSPWMMERRRTAQDSSPKTRSIFSFNAAGANGLTR